MIPEDDFRKLKIQVFECMKRLKGSGGPSASRFHVKLSKLIDGIENCQQNKLTLTNNIKTTEAKLNKTNCEFVNINEKIKEAQDDIKVTREAVERKEKLSSQQDHETKIRNSQVS
jgi:septal ring factor EnvC (AmiA/AmiB activator)